MMARKKKEASEQRPWTPHDADLKGRILLAETGRTGVAAFRRELPCSGMFSAPAQASPDPNLASVCENSRTAGYSPR